MLPTAYEMQIASQYLQERHFEGVQQRRLAAQLRSKSEEEPGAISSFFGTLLKRL
jgi:hypothetical protein